MNLLAEWSDTFPYDFCQTQTKARFKEVLDVCCTNDPTVRTYRTNILQNLNNKVIAGLLSRNFPRRNKFERFIASNINLIHLSVIEIGTL